MQSQKFGIKKNGQPQTKGLSGIREQFGIPYACQSIILNSTGFQGESVFLQGPIFSHQTCLKETLKGGKVVRDRVRGKTHEEEMAQFLQRNDNRRSGPYSAENFT